MSARWLSFVAVCFLVAVPAPVAAAESEDSPGYVFRIKSIDGLLEDIKYIANLAGNEEQARQLEGFVKSLAGEKGLEGLDTQRPLGLYGNIGAGGFDSTTVLLVPIANEKAFLDLLEGFNQKAEKGADDIYTVTSDKIPVALFLRFAHKYACVSVAVDAKIAKASLSKNKLLEPAKVFPAGKAATFSFLFRLDQVPEQFKNIFLGQLDLKLADEQDKKLPGETETQRKFRLESGKDVGKNIAALVKEGGELSMFLDVDRAAGELVGEVGLAAKSGSSVASFISQLGQAKSLFAGLGSGDAAMNLLLHAALPETFRQNLEPVIDELLKQTLQNAKDETQRDLTEKVLKSLEPTLKAGELDFGVSMRGPNKDNLYTIVGGLKIKDGMKIEQALRDLAKKIPERDREKIKFDAEKGIHQVTIQNDIQDHEKKVLGENPLYFALRQDALLVAVGPGGLEAIKEAMTVQPKVAPLFQIDLSMARLAPLMGQDQGDNVVKEILKAAQESFGGGDKKDDAVRISVQGGQALKARFSMKAPVVKFLSKADKAQKGKKKAGSSESDKDQ